MGWAWSCVGLGAGWQLAGTGPGLYLGFFERHRQPPGLAVAEATGTRGALRAAWVLAREAGAVGELLMTSVCRKASCGGSGAPMTSCAKCCIGLGSAPT
jgi:hypothetical protein